MFLVTCADGNAPAVTLMYTPRPLSSFKRILYLGICFFMSVASSVRASASLKVIIYEKSSTLSTIAWTLIGFFDVPKYCDTRRFKLTAFPMYIISPARLRIIYTPGDKGSSFNFGSTFSLLNIILFAFFQIHTAFYFCYKWNA